MDYLYFIEVCLRYLQIFNTAHAQDPLPAGKSVHIRSILTENWKNSKVDLVQLSLI